MVARNKASVNDDEDDFFWQHIVRSKPIVSLHIHQC